MNKVALVALCVLVAGCGNVYSRTVELVVGEETARAARSMFLAIQAGDYESAQGLLIDNAQVIPDSIWAEMRRPLVNADLDDAYATYFSVNWVPEGRATYLVYEGPSGDKWFRAEVRVRDHRIHHVAAYQFEESLAEENAVDWAMVISGGLGFLVVGVFAQVASLWVCVALWQSSMPKRKRWALGALIGVAQVSLNLNTGAVGWQLVSASVPVMSAGAQSPYLPWSLKMAFPLGALIAGSKLARYRRQRVAIPNPAVSIDP